MEQLLIVEDDKDLNQGLCKALRAEGRQIRACLDLRSCREQLALGPVSLVLLDINLPDGSGLDLLREIKEAAPRVPVILLTANDTDMDIVEGWSRGQTIILPSLFLCPYCGRGSIRSFGNPALPRNPTDIRQDRMFLTLRI